MRVGVLKSHSRCAPEAVRKFAVFINFDADNPTRYEFVLEKVRDDWMKWDLQGVIVAEFGVYCGLGMSDMVSLREQTRNEMRYCMATCA